MTVVTGRDVRPSQQRRFLLTRLRDEWLQVRPLPVTFSAGIAIARGGPEPTLRAADEALYEAKATGRDRWCWADAHAGEPLGEPLSYVDTYLVDAIVGNRRPAVRLAVDLRDSRVPEDRIVEDLLAAAQREVGERWFRNEITAADEHLASGVAGAALDALAAEMRPPTRPRDAGSTLRPMMCAAPVQRVSRWSRSCRGSSSARSLRPSAPTGCGRSHR